MNKNCKYFYWSTSIFGASCGYIRYAIVSGMLLMYGGKFPLVEKTNTNSKQFTHGNVDNLT